MNWTCKTRGSAHSPFTQNLTDRQDKVLLAAETIADSIVDSYSRPPTFDYAYKIAREGHVDPLREFTEACREERKAMLKNL